MALAVILVAAWPALAFDAKLEMDGPKALGGTLKSASLVLQAAEAKTPDPQDIVAAARADYANLLGVLYDNGYYGGTISIRIDGKEVANMSPFTVPDKIGKVRVTVKSGPLFHFGRAEIGPLAPGTELPKTFRTGEPAGAAVVRDAAAAAVTGWQEIGHAKAKVADRKLVANLPREQLDATVAVFSGRQLHFGKMTISGNGHVREKRIREIAGFPTGKTFSPKLIATAERRLREAGAFRSVALEQAEAANPDDSLDYALALVEEKPRRFGVGGEISSDQGVSLSAYWMHRNIFHGAERLRIDAEVGGIAGNSGGGLDYTLSATLTRPGTFSPANTMVFGLTASRLDEPDYLAKILRADLAISREISDRAKYSFGLSVLRERVNDDLGERDYFLVLLPLTAQLDARDKPLNPLAGHYLRFEVTPYAGFIDAEAGARLYGDARYYVTPGGDEGRFTLAGRVQVGSIVGSSIGATPPDMLFYSGGGGTVRGQPYQSLHVTLPGGVDIGGRNLIAASGELRMRATDSIQVVGFYDWGYVGSDSMPGKDGASQAGAGLGLRYDTSLGPIRFDVGAPVSGDTGKGVQIYIGIGQAF